MSTADVERLRALRGPALAAAAADDRRVEQVYEAVPGLGALDRMQRADLLGYLPDDLLVKVDRASMANSLEVRSPLLDHELIDFAAALPERIRAPRLRLKALLKAAFPELPAEIVQRRKMGFGVPIGTWFRGELGAQYEALVLQPESRARGWFDRSALAALLAEHRGGSADHAPLLWTVLMFEHWHRACLG
jgi:asparagine synthase (glutamine-hydrolysing)